MAREKWKPAKYQLKAAKILVEQNFSGILLKPGMRKTSIYLAAFKTLQGLGMAKAALVIAPVRVCYTSWPSELAKWEEFSGLTAGILHGNNKDEVLREKHDLYLINPEGLPWLFNELYKFKKWPFDVLCLDESSKFKNTNTQRFRLLKRWLPKFRRRNIMTGSPRPKSLLDLFPQVYIMDRGLSLGQYVTNFRREFFTPIPYGYVPAPGAEKQIYARLAPRLFYASDKDYLDLPPIIEKDVPIILPPKAMQIYKQMEDTLRLDFEKGTIVAANAGVASMKCRQIANGGVYTNIACTEWENIHDAKAEALGDLVEELGGQSALIAYEFRHDLDRYKKVLKSVLGEEVLHVGGTGGVPASKLPGLIKSWDRGDIPALLVSAQSMAHGVDGFQHNGRAIIWASLTYNYEDYDQLIRRLVRSGVRERILVAHLIAQGTIDHAIMSALRRKEKGQDTFFAALKAYWKI